MLTEDNYLLAPNKRRGANYSVTPIKYIEAGDKCITIQLPACNHSYSTDIDSVTKEECYTPTTAYRIKFVNTQGNEYTVSVVPRNSLELFCKYSKFKQIQHVINWYNNFAAVDWKGLPCKITGVEEFSYKGPLYKVQSKSANNIIISGIVFGVPDIDI